MVVLSTDMSIPKDVSRILVKVVTGGGRKYEFDYEIAPDGQIYLPGTLAIVEGKEPRERFRQRDRGSRGRATTRRRACSRKS